jgi:hypothetical protein
VKSGAAVTV